MASPGGDDERDWEDAREVDEREQWLQDNVPPHHG